MTHPAHDGAALTVTEGEPVVFSGLMVPEEPVSVPTIFERLFSEPPLSSLTNEELARQRATICVIPAARRTPDQIATLGVLNAELASRVPPYDFGHIERMTREIEGLAADIDAVLADLEDDEPLTEDEHYSITHRGVERLSLEEVKARIAGKEVP